MNVETVALSTRAAEALQPDGETPKGGAKTRASTDESRLRAEQARTEPAATPSAEPERAREAEEASEQEAVNNPLRDGLAKNPRFKLSFRVDEATQEVVVSVIDPETKDVIRQIPPEELLRLAERLDSARGSLVSSKV